jgi:hypothetical protein
MLLHDEAISLFLDVAGTCSAEIKFNELFETESDYVTLAVPSALKVDWRKRIITRVKEDSLYDHSYPVHNAIRAILDQYSYSLTSSKTTACLCSHTLCQMRDTMLMTHKPCCVAMRLPPASMAALALHPRATMTAPMYVPREDSVLPIADPSPVKPPVPLLSVVVQPTDAHHRYEHCTPSIADAPDTSDALEHMSSGTPPDMVTPSAHGDGVHRNAPTARVPHPPTMKPQVPSPRPLTNSEPP